MLSIFFGARKTKTIISRANSFDDANLRDGHQSTTNLSPIEHNRTFPLFWVSSIVEQTEQNRTESSLTGDKVRKERREASRGETYASPKQKACSQARLCRERK